MRTTLDIDDALLSEAKALAARERTTLTRLIEEGLVLRLRPSPKVVAERPVRLRSYKGKGGLVEGIDSRSNRSLFEAADGENGG